MTKKAFLKKLGANIARVRKMRGYSQDRLYLEGDFSSGTLSKIESGKVSPEVYTLARIAEILEVPLSELTNIKP